MMGDLYGWTGKVLHVDLSSGEVRHIDTAQYMPDYVGGVGLAARIAWDMLRPGMDAFDPESPLFLMVGPLTGTLASGAGRVEVLGIAPQQHPPVFSRSGMGGHWGAEVKYAGFDGIVVTGQAAKPVYLWIHNADRGGPRVEIREAGDLWGMGTFGVTRALRAVHGPQTRVVSCGQAGERRSRIAVIQTETGNAAGQGGYGGLMGAKRLKAIAVRGTQSVRIAHPRAFMELCMSASREGQHPGSFKPRNRMRGQRATETDGSGRTYRTRKCGFCITPCVNWLVQNVQAEDGTHTESVAQHCWGYSGTSRSVDPVARSLTGDYGLNGWEITFGIIPWLQMCKQAGLIDSIGTDGSIGNGNGTKGIPIPVGEKPVQYMRDVAPSSSEFLHALIQAIAFREGELGDALAEGTCYAAEHLFDGAGLPFLDTIYPRRCGQTHHWAGHWGPGGTVYWPWWLPPVLQWCTDTRDPASDSTHQWTEHVQNYMPVSGPRRGSMPEEQVRAVCEQVYGHPKVCDDRYTYDPPELKALPAMWHSHRGMLVNSLVLCDREHSRVFSTTSEDGKADTGLMAKLFSACTGEQVGEAELNQSGERIWNLLRAIDVRFFARDRAIDESTLDGFMYPGKDDGVMLTRERFGPLLDKYYQLSGWDTTTGWPTRAKLEELGLNDVADILQSEEKLGSRA